jgi:hypothetical protein
MIAAQLLGDCLKTIALACARPLLCHQSYGTVSRSGVVYAIESRCDRPEFLRNGFIYFYTSSSAMLLSLAPSLSGSIRLRTNRTTQQVPVGS